MRVLITGMAGFVGSYLAELCASKGCEVHGIERPDADKRRLKALGAGLNFHDADLADYDEIIRILNRIRPDRIFHLAAQSFVPLSWKAPQATFQSNVVGQANLFEAIREIGISPLVHVAGSSEEYGMVHENEIPIREENPLRPLSPYAVSKVAQDLMGYQYFMTLGLKTFRTRAFNHTGPRRNEQFVLSNFSRQIALIEAGIQEPVIRTGNLDVIRDFSDVRDVVRAYWMLLEKGAPGEVYNISSGIGRRLGDVLEMLLGRTKTKVRVEKDAERLRRNDLPRIVGDSTKFRKATGWKPEIPFEKTLEDLLAYWRGVVMAKENV